MSDTELTELVERCRNVAMTPDQSREQAINFVYGNLVLSNPNVTREKVEKAYTALYDRNAGQEATP